MSGGLVLFVCTANQCRSPMAEALAAQEIRRRGLHLEVASCGVRAVPGIPMTPAAEEALRRRDVHVEPHLSRAFDLDLAERADLITTMERDHLLSIAEHGMEPLSRTFPLRELVRIGTAREPDEPVRTWALRMDAERPPGQALRVDPADDVADPIGRSARHYRRCASDLAELVDRLLDLLGGEDRPVADGL
jgi:protein-tyrosine-phosphatase